MVTGKSRTIMEPKHGLPCIKCDSSDAMSIYGDGSGYCFSCKTRFFPDQIEAGSVDVRASESPSKERSSNTALSPSFPVKSSVRGLDEATLRYYGITGRFDETSGELKEVLFPVYRKGELTGAKVRSLVEKNHRTEGDCKSPDFFGANKVGEGGKLLVITEGEFDAMSAHQMLRDQGKNYNVVSLPNGANSGSVRKHINWIESFETIILNLDNDDIGREAAQEIGRILTPGKVKVMTLPVKDANEFLTTRRSPREYLKSLYNAKEFRPDGIISLGDAWEQLWVDDNKESVKYPWEGLNNLLYGLREREIVTWAAGTGAGKSQIMREIEHHLFTTTNDNIGVLALEESVGRTMWGILAVEANLPLAIREERNARDISQEEVQGWFGKTLATNRIHTFDHWGSTTEKNLLENVRHMIKGLGCKWIILDHLSIVVSAMNDMGDERKAIDSIMTKLRQLTEETGASMQLVVHLRRLDGNRGHEQGVEIGLSHLRGSQAIAQLSDAVVAAERNQQAETDRESNLTCLRVLKNRYAGLTGVATHLAYDRNTGRLSEVQNVEEYLAADIEGM